MPAPVQKTIEEYLEGKNIPAGKKEPVLAAITHLVYARNQNLVESERETDQIKKKQLLHSITEYDDIIEREINDIIAGKQDISTYDF